MLKKRFWVVKFDHFLAKVIALKWVCFGFVFQTIFDFRLKMRIIGFVLQFETTDFADYAD
jgi:hypothetical protein